MSLYWIQAPNGDMYSLDSTTEVDFSETGSLSDVPLETGVSIADHYIDKAITIKFTGTISSVKSLRISDPESNPSIGNPRWYIESLRRLKKERTPLTVYSISEMVGEDNFFFETLNFSQNQQRGSVGGASSLAVSLTLVQARYTDAAVVGRISKKEVNDLLASESKSAAAGLSFDEQQEESLRAYGERQIKASLAGKQASARGDI